MNDEITKLDSPIDVMYLMHEAYHSVSMKVEKIAFDLQNKGDLEPFKKSVWNVGQAPALPRGH